jgi:hypothetical protein
MSIAIHFQAACNEAGILRSCAAVDLAPSFGAPSSERLRVNANLVCTPALLGEAMAELVDACKIVGVVSSYRAGLADTHEFSKILFGNERNVDDHGAPLIGFFVAERGGDDAIRSVQNAKP